MARINVMDSVEMEDNNLKTVKPALDSHRVPFNNDPTSFKMYGENSLHSYNEEVRRVKAEIRREVYGQEEVSDVECKKSRANCCSIFAFIFGLLILAELILGKFFTLASVPTLFVIADGASGLTFILNIVSSMTSGAEIDTKTLILALGIAMVALFTVITFLTGLFTMKLQGTCVIMKICLFLSFVGAILTALMLLIESKELAIGLYVLIVLTFISTLIGFCSKSSKKKNKAE